MTKITINPTLPYFAAMADCDWDAAERIAEPLGEEHVLAVHRAAALAEAEELLADMDSGWCNIAPEEVTYIDEVCGVYALAECRSYRDGYYDCSDGEARRKAREELRRLISDLSA